MTFRGKSTRRPHAQIGSPKKSLFPRTLSISCPPKPPLLSADIANLFYE
jgi:hypothetical protein